MARRGLIWLAGVSSAPNERMARDTLAPVLRWLRREFEVLEGGAVAPEARVDLAAVVLVDAGHGFAALPTVDRSAGVPLIWISLADAHSPSRVRWLPQIQHLQPELVLSFDVMAAEFLPGLRDRLAVCPWFVEPGEEEVPPLERMDHDVALLGAGFRAGDEISAYRWRLEAGAAVAAAEGLEELRCLWSQRGSEAHTYAVEGADYEGALRASGCALACGSLRQTLVKKHLQIPAAGTVLLAAPDPVLGEVGFVDGKNALLVEAGGVVEAILALRADPARRLALARAGQRLVAERHGPANRPHLRHWLAAWRERELGKRVVQTSLLGEFGLARAADGTTLVLAESVAGAAVREVFAALWSGRWEGATAGLALLEGSFPNALETRVGRALWWWRQGREGEVIRVLEELVRLLARLGLDQFEPVAWALYQRSLPTASAWREPLARSMASLAHPSWTAGEPTAVSVLPIPAATAARWQRYWRLARSRVFGRVGRF